MSFCTVNFFGNSIGLTTSMNVLLPDSGNGPFPVFYLLHGLSDDHTIWHRRTNIERYVAGVPMIVVMPTTHRGFYTNGRSPGTYRYEDHIVQDIVGYIDRVFPSIKSGSARAIGGLSMGGYGAVKLALKYPDLFCSATSHSGALTGPNFARGKLLKSPEPGEPEFIAMFSEQFKGGPDDLDALAEECPRDKRPAIRIDCGTEDFLLDANRHFHQTLTRLNFAHEYEEFPGSHDWGYWDLHVQEAVAFHRRQLKV